MAVETGIYSSVTERCHGNDEYRQTLDLESFYSNGLDEDYYYDNCWQQDYDRNNGTMCSVHPWRLPVYPRQDY